MLRCYRRFYCAQLGVIHYSWTQQARLEDAAPFGTWDWGFITVMSLPHSPLFLFPGGVLSFKRPLRYFWSFLSQDMANQLPQFFLIWADMAATWVLLITSSFKVKKEVIHLVHFGSVTKWLTLRKCAYFFLYMRKILVQFMCWEILQSSQVGVYFSAR